MVVYCIYVCIGIIDGLNTFTWNNLCREVYCALNVYTSEPEPKKSGKLHPISEMRISFSLFNPTIHTLQTAPRKVSAEVSDDNDGAPRRTLSVRSLARAVSKIPWERPRARSVWAWCVGLYIWKAALKFRMNGRGLSKSDLYVHILLHGICDVMA